MHIETTRSGNSRCHLLRQSYWQDGKPKKRTLCNLSALPEHAIEALKRALKRGPALNPDNADVELRASRAHGAVSAVLGTLRDIGLDRVIFHRPDRRRALVIAMIVARLIRPGAKLRVERELGAAGTTTLAALLGVEGVSVDELYAAMDWLGARQGAIERKLARRHLGEDDLVLYDVSSSYMEGNACPMAKRGYSRDRRGDRPQIVYGLLCTRDGCPVSIEAFAGNTGDPMTLASQVRKVRDSFGIRRVVLVGDRGMIAQTRIDRDLAPNGIDWITALRASSIRKLVDRGHVTPGLFDTWGLARVTTPDYPGERLIVCYNPVLAAERKRNRDGLLNATETDARDFAARHAAGDIDRDELNRRLGTLRRRKMAKHFRFEFDEGSGTFSCERDRGVDRRRGRPRRSLRHTHQRGRGRDRGRRGGPRLQEPVTRRARLPLAQDGVVADPPDLPLARRPSTGASSDLHAGLVCRVAHAPQAGAAAVRRGGRSAAVREPGGAAGTLGKGPAQGQAPKDG